MTTTLKILTLRPLHISILAGFTDFGVTAEAPNVAALSHEHRALLVTVLAEEESAITDHDTIVGYGFKLRLDGKADELLTYERADEGVTEALQRVLAAEIATRAALADAILADAGACIQHFPNNRVGHRWVSLTTRADGPLTTLYARDEKHPAALVVLAEAERRNAADVAAWKADLLAGKIVPDQYGAYYTPTAINGDPEVAAYIAAAKAAR